MLNTEKFKSVMKQKYTSKRNNMKDEKGIKLTDKMKKKIKDRISKKHGGSVAEKLAKARKNNPVRNMKKQGKSKIEAQKARIRNLIKKKY